MLGDVEVEDAPTIVSEHHEDEQDAKVRSCSTCFVSSRSSSAATATSPSRTWPCVSNSPYTSKRGLGRNYARKIGSSGWRWPESGPGGDSLL